MAPSATDLAELARGYLARQPWFLRATESTTRSPIELVTCVVVDDGDPGFARLVFAYGDRRLQLLVGWRSSMSVSGELHGEQSALLGAASDGAEQVVVYEALADDALCRRVLGLATGGREEATLVRPVTSLVSHASLVFDERLFMKCYRVLERGARPEVEVLFGLDEVGFNAVLAPIGRWREDEFDLALVREFLPSALEGRLLALTSLRDLLGQVSPGDEHAFNAVGDLSDPERAVAAAGGDFAAEMERMGQMTARLHVALAQAFGSRLALREDFGSALDDADGDAAIVRTRGDAFGRALRVHGDYHLRRVMRTETGWVVAGFADDPLYAPGSEEPSLPGRIASPLEDLADMSFALGQLIEEGLRTRRFDERELATTLAHAWKRRNRLAFLRGYHSVGEVAPLLPPHSATEELLLGALEAVRDRRYEATPSEE